MKIQKISKILKIFDDSQKLETSKTKVFDSAQKSKISDISEVFSHVNSTKVEKEFT